MTEEKKLIPGCISLKPYGFVIDYLSHDDEKTKYIAVDFESIANIDYENVSKLIALVADAKDKDLYVIEIHLKDSSIYKIAGYFEVVDIVMNAWLSRGANVEEVDGKWKVKDKWAAARPKS